MESRPRRSTSTLAELDLDSTAEVLFAARRPPPSAELFSTDDQLMGFDMEMPTLSSGLLVRARCPSFFVATTRRRSRVDGVELSRIHARRHTAMWSPRRRRRGRIASARGRGGMSLRREGGLRLTLDNARAIAAATMLVRPWARRRTGTPTSLRVAHREGQKDSQKDQHRARTTYSQKGSGARGSVRWEASAPRGRTTAAGRGRAATPSPLNRRWGSRHRGAQRTQRTAARHALSGAPKRQAGATTARAQSDAHPGPDQPVARFRGTVAATVADPPGARLLDPGPAPAYELLVNFPRAKSRTQLHCVMSRHALGRTCEPARARSERAPATAGTRRLDGLGDDQDDAAAGLERAWPGRHHPPEQGRRRECDKEA